MIEPGAVALRAARPTTASSVAASGTVALARRALRPRHPSPRQARWHLRLRLRQFGAATSSALLMVMRRWRFRRHSIDGVEALARQRDGRIVLVDVREQAQRVRAFVPGSRHLPLGELEARLGELPRDRPLAFMCADGRRSAMAATIARRAGLDARCVAGGMEAWQRHGLDLVRLVG